MRTERNPKMVSLIHVKLWCSNTGSIDRTATSHFTRLSSAGDRFQNFNSLKTFKLSRRTPCGVVVIRRGTERRRIRVMGSSLWVHNSQKTCKLCHVLAAFFKHCMVPFSLYSAAITFSGDMRQPSSALVGYFGPQAALASRRKCRGRVRCGYCSNGRLD
jgi:hypothetical protein